MFDDLRDRLLRRGRNERDAKTTADCIEVSFYCGRQSTPDTVVFVHGLGGHFSATWGDFPLLLRADEELPLFDILQWGYDGSPFPGTVGVTAEGRRLMSDLRQNLPDAENNFFVAHSLGGLAVLKGLCDELHNNAAQRLPVSAVRHILLYATPAMGADAATLAVKVLERIPGFKWLQGEYLSELAQGKFVNALLNSVVNRMYLPHINRGEESSKCRIPITACVAVHDEWVEQTSAEGVFSDPPPVYLNFDHGTVKLPTSHYDRRYLPVKNVLSAHFSQWFHRLAGRALNDSHDGRSAAIELLSRCSQMIEQALKVLPRHTGTQAASRDSAQRRLEFLRTLVQVGHDFPSLSLAKSITVAGEIYDAEE